VVRRRFVNRADRSITIIVPVEDQCRWLHTIGFAEMDCYFKIYKLAVFGEQKPM
jgi:tRNA (cmo5U34)-methyltransferase